MRRGGERLGLRVPAALLDARDRDPCLALGADEHGHVEDPVLLCADQFLAVVEQHVGHKRIRHSELRNRSGRVDLRDAQPERQGLIEGEVGSLGRAAWEQWRDDDASVLYRVAELDVGLDHGVAPFRF